MMIKFDQERSNLRMNFTNYLRGWTMQSEISCDIKLKKS